MRLQRLRGFSERLGIHYFGKLCDTRTFHITDYDTAPLQRTVVLDDPAACHDHVWGVVTPPDATFLRSEAVDRLSHLRKLYLTAQKIKEENAGSSSVAKRVDKENVAA